MVSGDMPEIPENFLGSSTLKENLYRPLFASTSVNLQTAEEMLMIEACGNAMRIADKALSIGRRQHTVRPHATRTLCKPDPNTIRKASPEPSGAPPLCHCPPPGHTSVQQQQRRRYRSRESRGHGDGSRGPASTHRRRVSRRAHPAAGRAVRARSWQLAGRHSRPELSYFRRLRRTTSCKSGARRATNPSAALPAARSGTRSRDGSEGGGTRVRPTRRRFLTCSAAAPASCAPAGGGSPGPEGGRLPPCGETRSRRPGPATARNFGGAGAAGAAGGDAGGRDSRSCCRRPRATGRRRPGGKEGIAAVPRGRASERAGGGGAGAGLGRRGESRPRNARNVGRPLRPRGPETSGRDLGFLFFFFFSFFYFFKK